MCQLFGVSAAATLNVSFSWERFALKGSEEFGNPDGWGVAYFEGADCQIVREPEPAADSDFVRFLGTHGPPSPLILSHVRRAAVGERILANTQPFVRRMGGRTHVFAHNGYLPIADRDDGPLWLMPVGQTDSERAFCRLLSMLEPVWARASRPSLAERTSVVETFAAEMRALGAANFLYTDGLTLFAHGHRKTVRGAAISREPGLYVLESEDGSPGLCDGVGTQASCGKNAIVATVPLDGQSWTPLSAGELLRIERGQLL